MITDHGKEAKQNKYGKWYCPTPVEKDAQGNVTAWCTWKATDLAQSGVVEQAVHEASKQIPVSAIWKPKEDDVEGRVRHGVYIALIGAKGPVIDWADLALTPEMEAIAEDYVKAIMKGGE